MPGVHQQALLERDRELAQLEALLDEASAGEGRLVLIEGAGGIGKTALLGEIKQRGGERGFATLSARASEIERDFPFGVVRQLFQPVFRRARPAKRKRLLQGPAAVAAPVVGLDAPQAGSAHSAPTSDSSLPTLHGLYWLVANVSADGALLLAADDVQWSDPASLRFFTFLLPRLVELPLLLALTVRPGEPGAESELIDRIAGDAATQRFKLGPLSEPAVADLVREELSDHAEHEFCRALYEATGGNPFLVRELVRELTFEGIDPTAAEASQLFELAPETIVRAVLVRLASAGNEAAMLARTVAVLGDGCELRVAAVLASLDQGEADSAADTLGRVGILAPVRPLSFVHPILRAAVYSDIEAGERSRLHVGAARLLERDGATPEAVAVHFLSTDPAGDASTVQILRAAARGALASGSPATAVSLLRRALREPPPAEVRTDVRFELGAAEYTVDPASALATFEQAAAATDDARVRAKWAPTLALACAATADFGKALEVLERESSAVSESDFDLALLLEAERLEFEVLLLGQGGAPLSVAGQDFYDLAEALEGRRPGEQRYLAVLAHAASWSGVPAAQVASLAERALSGGRLIVEQTAESLPVHVATLALVFAERFDVAARVVEQTLADARKRGSVVGFIWSAGVRSYLNQRRGAITTAEADGRGAVAVAREHGLLAATPHVLAWLVDALIERGELEAAWEEMEKAGFGAEIPQVHHAFVPLLFSRARLRLAEGRTREGLEDLLEMDRWQQRSGVVVPAGSATPDTAIALAALGDKEGALRFSERALELARLWGTPGTLGIALRSCALAHGGERRIELLREAVDALASSELRLEHARALTDLGAALRRTRRRSEAREPLRRGLELARGCEATALVRQASEELSATGERVRVAPPSGSASLTPSERRIAEMAAKGTANREIAQALFVTLKTVEAHLSHAYRKLDISSRRELARALRRVED